MSGVYGDMLLAWTEQIRTVEVYDMDPLINGGWEPVKDKSGDIIKTAVRGVFQNTRGGGIRDENGNLVRHDGREFWTKTAGLAGKFLDWDGDVYRLTDNNNWSHEGGFWRYGLEKVVGNNGAESVNPTWNTGGNSFC